MYKELDSYLVLRIFFFMSEYGCLRADMSPGDILNEIGINIWNRLTMQHGGPIEQLAGAHVLD